MKFIKTESEQEDSTAFNVNRSLWADQSIFYDAHTYVSKLNDKEKVRGRIVGLSEYNYLIFEMPMIIGFRTKFPVGSSIVVKFVKHGTVYGFYTKILQSYFDPAPIIFSDYPKEIESFEFRGYKRFSCNIPALMNNGLTQHYCIIKDISAGGCLLTIKEWGTDETECIAEQSPVVLTLDMCGVGKIELECFVRNVQETNQTISYGLEFQNSGEAYTRIEKYFELLSE